MLKKPKWENPLAYHRDRWGRLRQVCPRKCGDYVEPNDWGKPLGDIPDSELRDLDNRLRYLYYWKTQIDRLQLVKAQALGVPVAYITPDPRIRLISIALEELQMLIDGDVPPYEGEVEDESVEAPPDPRHARYMERISEIARAEFLNHVRVNVLDSTDPNSSRPRFDTLEVEMKGGLTVQIDASTLSAVHDEIYKPFLAKYFKTTVSDESVGLGCTSEVMKVGTIYHDVSLGLMNAFANLGLPIGFLTEGGGGSHVTEGRFSSDVAVLRHVGDNYLYLHFSSLSNQVGVLDVPEGITSAEIFADFRDYYKERYPDSKFWPELEQGEIEIIWEGLSV